MCLSVVNSRARDRKREGLGWKVFAIRNGKLCGEYYGGIRKEGVWLKSRNDGSEDYPLGFHIIKTRREARAWNHRRIFRTSCLKRVRKVKFRDVLAEGIQLCGSVRIIVAKEMMILPN